ncbi:MAG: hypothetical protein LBN27_12180 [Prevotellaceae bacterium]|nr:hypothetical protein [Prevotellaceae bacterium]
MKCNYPHTGCPYRACLSDDCQRIDAQANGAEWRAACYNPKILHLTNH